MVSLSNHEVRDHSAGTWLLATPSWFDKLTMRAAEYRTCHELLVP
jgi:hypothetical protein